MMEPINLNKARKVRQRAEKGRKAAENRVKYGRTKAQKAQDTLERERFKVDLDKSQRSTQDD